MLGSERPINLFRSVLILGDAFSKHNDNLSITRENFTDFWENTTARMIFRG